MPVNSTNRIDSVVDVVAVASYAFSNQDALVSVQEIPTGGTVLLLPEDPSSGDWYEGADGDGTCSSSHPLHFAVTGEGQTIQGGDSLALTSAYASARVRFSERTRAWIAFISGSGGGGGGGISAVDAGPGIDVVTVSTVATVSNLGVLEVEAGENVTVTGTAQAPIINAPPSGPISAFGADLQTSTATQQWVSSISGANGLGGTVGLFISGFQIAQAQTWSLTQQAAALNVQPVAISWVAQAPNPATTINAPSASPGPLSLDTGTPVTGVGFATPIQILAKDAIAVLLGNIGSAFSDSCVLALGPGVTRNNIATTYNVFGDGTSNTQINSPGAGSRTTFLANGVPSWLTYLQGPVFGGTAGGAHLAGTGIFGDGVGLIGLVSADTEPTAIPTVIAGVGFAAWASELKNSIRVWSTEGAIADLVSAGDTLSGAQTQQQTKNLVTTIVTTTTTVPTPFPKGLNIATPLVCVVEYVLRGQKRSGEATPEGERGQFVVQNNAGTLVFGTLLVGTQVTFSTSSTPLLSAVDAGGGNIQFLVTSPDTNTDDWTVDLVQWVM